MRMKLQARQAVRRPHVYSIFRSTFFQGSRRSLMAVPPGASPQSSQRAQFDFTVPVGVAAVATIGGAMVLYQGDAFFSAPELNALWLSTFAGLSTSVGALIAVVRIPAGLPLLDRDLVECAKWMSEQPVHSCNVTRSTDILGHGGDGPPMGLLQSCFDRVFLRAHGGAVDAVSEFL